MFKTKSIPSKKKWPKVAAAFFVFLFGVSIPQAIFYVDRKAEEIKQETGRTLEAYVDQINTKGISFVYGSKEAQITPTLSAPFDLDLTYQVFNIDLEKTLAKLNSLEVPEKIKIVVSGIKTKPIYTLDEEKIRDILEQNFSQYETRAQNAKIALKDPLGIEVVPEKSGFKIDYDEAIKIFKNRLENLDAAPVPLHLISEAPQVLGEMVYKHIPEFQAVLDKKEKIILEYKSKKWELPRSEYQNFLELQKTQDESIKVTLSSEGLAEFLEPIAKDINVPLQEAKFVLEDGRVKEFAPSRGGAELNIEKTLKKIQENLHQPTDEVELVVETTKPKITTESVNELGIKELLGVGRSNFAGSPTNRRFNIKVGARALNGLLIKPEEEFSLVKALGDINGEKGYLPELVIKGNKTIPEFGGGLCQIGTTTFRAALDSGLPITERQSHSYRVRYYEPAGVDATIYGPHPDFRFINDTGRHILIQTRIEGDNAIFEFWGTHDGRLASRTDPKIFNIVSAPPTKFIETEDLPEGQKKCTEQAHEGAKTEFTYTVQYPNGEVKEKVFKSHYRPWGAVCLVGKKKE